MPEPTAVGGPRAELRTVVDGWSVVTGSANTPVTVHDLSFLGVCVVKGDESLLTGLGGWGRTVPLTASAFVSAYAPGERVVVAESSGEAQRLADTLHGVRARFDLSHGRTALRVVGEPAESILARVSELPLDRVRFPNGGAARGLLGNLTVAVNRIDLDGVLSYLLVVPRSAGRYLADLLCEAGHDLGVGWGPPDIGLSGTSQLGEGYR
jgi:heterotetrameric sarcosine oxidase gamma subunit